MYDQIIIFKLNDINFYYTSGYVIIWAGLSLIEVVAGMVICCGKAVL